MPECVGLGNTNSQSSSNKVNPSMHWFFTWNNYPDNWKCQLCQSFDKISDKYAIQEEIGANGTPHLQGVVSLKKRARWTEFKLPKEIHWEKVKSIPDAYQYCQKEDTRKPDTLPLTKGLPKPLKLITPSKPWQKQIIDILHTEPDDRTVHWFWSHAGGIGKSQFAKYCVAKENCLFFEEGKKADIMHLIFEAPDDKLERIIIDVPRDNGNNVSYKAIESIKNGMIYSSKYEGGYKLFNSPHIIVFANMPPQEERLSSDRWFIQNIDEDLAKALTEDGLFLETDLPQIF